MQKFNVIVIKTDHRRSNLLKTLFSQVCYGQLLVRSIFYIYKTAENLSHYSPKGFNFLILFPCLTFVYLHSRNKQMKIAKPFGLIGDAIKKSQIINNGRCNMLVFIAFSTQPQALLTLAQWRHSLQKRKPLKN